MHTERFDFPSAGGNRLAARLDRPHGSPAAYALFAHCFTCGKDINAASRIAGALVARGIGTLRFDFTGLGGSDGDFANTGFSSNLDDLAAAAAYMRESGRPISLLIGHSLGGAAVLAVAERLQEVTAVAVIAAPMRVDHVVHQFAEHVPAIEARGEAVVSLAGRPFTIRKSFLEDARSQDQGARVARLGRPLLVMHSPLDVIVGVENARAIFESARHPKSFVSLDDADHLLSRRRDAEYAAGVLAAWAARYLPEREAAPAPAARPDNAVVVEETGRGRFQQAVTVGPHRLLADEPVSFGGLGSGLGPYDLLLAALGACTAMTLRLYAERNGLPLKLARVTLRHCKIHAVDCTECETRDGKLDDIESEITLVGDLDASERARLLEIANRCPVHRTLHSEVRIRTIAAPSPSELHEAASAWIEGSSHKTGPLAAC